MLRYQTQRHRRLMRESEQALSDAAEAPDTRPRGRIARQVLGESRLHSLWESRHAELLRDVAERGRRVPQVLELRKLSVSLIHRTALINYIRYNKVGGERRDRLFRVFYGPKDRDDSILTEHRQYMLATSSSVSTDHLIDVMVDPVSQGLLRAYDAAYSNYFDLFCCAATSDDPVDAGAIRLIMKDAAERTRLIRNQLSSVRPERGHSSFDRQALLAQSGRYPILNYMVG